MANNDDTLRAFTVELGEMKTHLRGVSHEADDTDDVEQRAKGALATAAVRACILAQTSIIALDDEIGELE